MTGVQTCALPIYPKDGRILKINGQRLKPFLGGVIPKEETMSMEILAYWDAT